ncbi:hypothetical protein BS78_10G106200 [Paspalum vaginatum]|nr:hypothetical protein BS78_10G106200 [Paspalum vaginatum]
MSSTRRVAPAHHPQAPIPIPPSLLLDDPPLRPVTPQPPPHIPSAVTLSLLRTAPGLVPEPYAPSSPSHPTRQRLHSRFPRYPPSTPSWPATASRRATPLQAPRALLLRADAASFLRDSLAAGPPAPDISAINSLLSVLDHAGNMRRPSCVFTFITYGLRDILLLNGLCKAGRVRHALMVLDGMSRPGSDIRQDLSF